MLKIEIDLDSDVLKDESDLYEDEAIHEAFDACVEWLLYADRNEFSGHLVVRGKVVGKIEIED